MWIKSVYITLITLSFLEIFTGQTVQYNDTACKILGGTCMNISNYCPRSYISGKCGELKGIECCPGPDWGCLEINGTCQNYTENVCQAGYELGLCGGDANRRCCRSCDVTCQNLNTTANNDTECESMEGTCMDDSNYCSQSYLPDKCGGPPGRRCCPGNDWQCTYGFNGTCQNYVENICISGYMTGLCFGHGDRRCCRPCDKNCQNTENSYNDTACENIGGSCMVDTNYCIGSYISGKCGGPSERRCCFGRSTTSEVSSGVSTTFANPNHISDANVEETETYLNLAIVFGVLFGITTIIAIALAIKFRDISCQLQSRYKPAESGNTEADKMVANDL